MDLSEQFDGLAGQAINRLTRALSADKPLTQEELVLAKLSMGVVTSWARFRQTETMREAMLFSVARSIAKPGKLRETVSVLSPRSPMLRAILPSQ